MDSSVNIANVVSANVDGAFGLFVVDPSSGRVYSISAREADPETAGRVMMAVRGQMRAEMPEFPQDYMRQAILAKDQIVKDSRNIFKRGE